MSFKLYFLITLLYSKKYKIFIEIFQIDVIFNFERILSKIHPKAKAQGFLFDEIL
jgi:hypothetical protein